MKLTIASVLSLIGAAAAATDGPYSIGPSPSGFETGVLNSTILCNVSATGLNLKNQQIGFGIAAILPNRVNVSQPFYVQAAARLIVPASINNLAYGFGARTYAGNATKVIVNAQGSTPSVVDAASTPLAIPSAPVVSGGVSVLNVPAVGASIQAGPFTGASANSNIVFSFGALAAVVATYNSNGGRTFLTANISCPAQVRPASLAYVAVGGAGSTSTVNPAGVASIPTIPVNSTAGTTAYTYTCTFSDVGTSPVTLSVGGVKVNNAPVASGSNFAISLGQGNIYVTPALTSLFTAKYSSGTAYSLKVDTLNFASTNASPATLNGIPSGGLSTPIAPVSSTTAVLSIPSNAPASTLPDISFTATGASGTTALLSIGSAAGSVTVYDSSNSVIANVPFSCPASSPNVPVLPYDIA